MKYFAWKENGFFNCQRLISEIKIEAYKNILDKDKVDMFETIQTYDEQGNLLYVPFYADLDGEKALEDTRLFVKAIISAYNIMPLIYFSGSKGFHVTIPCKINNHLTVRKMVEKLGTWQSLDLIVYSNRRLLRIPFSRHSSTMLYKVPISYKMLNELNIYQISYKAKKPNIIGTIDECIVTDKFKNSIEINNVVISSKSVYNSKERSDGILAPCVEKLLNSILIDGERNTTFLLIISNMRYVGLNYEQAETLLREKQPTLEKIYMPVLKSIYTKPVRPWGCKNHQYSNILQRMCTPLCEHSKEEIKL